MIPFRIEARRFVLVGLPLGILALTLVVWLAGLDDLWLAGGVLGMGWFPCCCDQGCIACIHGEYADEWEIACAGVEDLNCDQCAGFNTQTFILPGSTPIVGESACSWSHLALEDFPCAEHPDAKLCGFELLLYFNEAFGGAEPAYLNVYGKEYLLASTGCVCLDAVGADLAPPFRYECVEDDEPISFDMNYLEGALPDCGTTIYGPPYACDWSAATCTATPVVPP